MYVVRNKRTKEIIHVNPAPLSQQLEGVEVYFKFDPDTMEIGKTDAPEIPRDFNINEDGEIVALTVKKPLSEQVDEGKITLAPTQKIVGEGENEQIVEKTFSEQVAEGLIELASNQKLVGEEIVEKTSREMFDEGLITLDEFKRERIQYYSRVAFQKRNSIIPDYKLQNAALGIYDEQTTANYKATVQAFRDEFYRIKALIEEAETIDEIEAITENFPKEIVVATPNS